MDNQLLHEAGGLTVDKLFGMATGVISAQTGINSKNKDSYSYSSIAKAASKLIAVFPVIASRTVSSDTAHMCSKYVEQTACQFFTLALQAGNISSAENGIEYLKKYHQNLEGDGTNAVIAGMQSWIDAYKNGKIMESSSVYSDMYNSLNEANETNYDYLLESDKDLRISPMDMRDLLQLMKENANIEFYDLQLNPISINDFVVNEFADGTYHVSIKPLDEATTNRSKSYRGLRKYYRDQVVNGNMSEDEAYQAQADEDADTDYDRSNTKWKQDQNDRSLRNARDSERHKNQQDDRNEDRAWTRQDRANREADRNEDRAWTREDRQNKREDREWTKQDRKYKEEEREWRRNDREAQNRRDEEERKARKSSGRNVSVLRDQDIKKMNDAAPSLLVVKFYHSYEDKDNHTIISDVPTEFIIGVKTHLIPVTTSEILRRIVNDNKDGKKFINFMRAITGELKASELILGMSRIKDDVKSCRVKGAYGDMWNLLARRAAAAREQVKRGQRNDFSAITTVLISQSDVDDLFHEENIDISDPKNAIHFMKSYNLFGFMIADDATESLKVLYDNGSSKFEEIAYRMLERETQDGTYKKMINLMASTK